jgi:hypothetical protein
MYTFKYIPSMHSTSKVTWSLSRSASFAVSHDGLRSAPPLRSTNRFGQFKARQEMTSDLGSTGGYVRQVDADDRPGALARGSRPDVSRRRAALFGWGRAPLVLLHKPR